MFTEIRQALLPLALRKIQRRGDLERAGLLIDSLAKHWRDIQPFELLIVAPRRDASLLRTSLPRFPNIDVAVRPESDFFSPFSRFYLMTGWYRQQIVKLQVPAMLGFGGYLTLDSDVCCVGDFDATHLRRERPGAVALGAQAPSRLVAKRRRRSSGVPYDARATACR